MRRLAPIAILHCLLAACGASTGLVAPPPADVPVTEDRGAAMPRGPFDRCAVGDTCTGATGCIPVNLTSSGQPARLCTTTCASAASCPNRGVHSSLPVSCVVVGVGATMGQCLESCDTDQQCGVGTRCTTLPAGPLPVCVPIAN